MALDPQILLLALLTLLSVLATAFYARQRMDIRVAELHEDLRNEFRSLYQSVQRVQDRVIESAAEITQQGLRDEELSEAVSTVNSALDGIQESVEQTNSSLNALSKRQSAFEELSTDSEEKRAIELERLRLQVSGLQGDLEMQLSVERVADVEQIAITAAHMAGDSLAKLCVDSPNTVSSHIHGHSLLMYQMLLDASNGTKLDARGGYHVLEIGTTREKWWPQMSTSRLAALCRTLAYKMLTVDVDELGSEAGRHTRRFYGATVDTRTASGEQFVSDWEGELPPYIYIDAYDYEHNAHSEERQERYKVLQGSPINDEDCWAMHLKCAVAFAEKCPAGGVVVFDDVFSEGGRWLGKGKLAAPYLLDAGFELTSQTDKTAVFRKPQATG